MFYTEWVCLLANSLSLRVHTLNIAPLRESSPQKRSGMTRVLKGSCSFTCASTRSSAIGMSHTCLCLPDNSRYSYKSLGLGRMTSFHPRRCVTLVASLTLISACGLTFSGLSPAALPSCVNCAVSDDQCHRLFSRL